MSRLSALTTAAERTLLVCSVLLVLAVHFAGWLAPAWMLALVPLADETRQLLPIAQIVLLAAWVAGGIGPLWLRLGLGPVLFVSWAVAWGDSFSSSPTSQWLLLSGLMAALMGGGIRCLGFRLGAEMSLPAEARHPQFSIRGLILLTTLIAVTLGTLEMLRPALRTAPELSTALERVWIARSESNPAAEFVVGVTTRSVVLASALAAVSLVSMACVLRPGPMWLRLIVTAILVPLTGLYLANLTDSDEAAGISMAVSLTLLSAITGISVWPLRLLGVRLIGDFGYGVRGLVTALRPLGWWRSSLSQDPKAATSRRTPNLKEAIP
jgi:hypothetical protein